MWNIIPIIWLCLLLAAILGGIIGWLLKSLSCKKASAELQARLNERDAEISRLRTSVSKVKGDANAENNKDDAEISALRAQVSSLESNIAGAAKADSDWNAKYALLGSDVNSWKEKYGKLEADFSGKSAGYTSLEAELNALKSRASTLEVDLAECKKANSGSANVATSAALVGSVASSSGDNAENASLKARVSELEAKLDEVEGEKDYLLIRMKKAESGESIARVVPMDQRDDLELIHGVGPVLEGMLYDMGIYFFKDVAGWDDAKIDEVSEQLPRFKNRIRREGWVESAKDEHFKKYGVKL
jgi:predicted flap endonuclease-1-like 5' DNA nuclease